MEFMSLKKRGSTISTNRYMIKSTLNITRCCPLVIQGFSNVLGLFQVIKANPVFPFLGDQTMQNYGNIEGFSLNGALFGLVI